MSRADLNDPDIRQQVRQRIMERISEKMGASEPATLSSETQPDRSKQAAALGIHADQNSPFGIAGAETAVAGPGPAPLPRGFFGEMGAAAIRTPYEVVQGLGATGAGLMAGQEAASEVRQALAPPQSLAPSRNDRVGRIANLVGAAPSAMATGPALGGSMYSSTLERTEGNQPAAMAAGAVGAAAGFVQPLAVIGKIPGVNEAVQKFGVAPVMEWLIKRGAESVLAGGANVAAGAGTEQIARAAGAEPIEQHPIEQFLAGALPVAAIHGTVGAVKGGIAAKGMAEAHLSENAYTRNQQMLDDIQGAYGSRTSTPTEGIPTESYGPPSPDVPPGPPETPYTPQRGFRGAGPEQAAPGVSPESPVGPSSESVMTTEPVAGTDIHASSRPVTDIHASSAEAQAETVTEATPTEPGITYVEPMPTPAQNRAVSIDVEKVAKQHRDDIIEQSADMPVDDFLAMDQQLHRNAVEQGRFPAHKDAYLADIPAKQEVRDLLNGKLPPTPENIDKAKGILARGRTTHVNMMDKRGNANVGGKDWHRAMIQMYDRAIAAVDELVTPPPPLTGGDAATARALLRPDNPDVKVGGKWLKKDHKLTKAGEEFLARQSSPTPKSSSPASGPSASPASLGIPASVASPLAATPTARSTGSKPISFHYDPATKSIVVDPAPIEPPSPEKMRELMKKPAKGKPPATPEPFASPPKPSALSQPPATPETGARTKTSASEARKVESPAADVEKAGPSKQDSVSATERALYSENENRELYKEVRELRAALDEKAQAEKDQPPPKQPPTEPAEQPAGATSARKAWMDADREGEFGLDGLPEAKKKAQQKTFDEAKPEEALSLATSVNANPRPLKDHETASIVVRAAELKDRHQTETDPVELARIEEEFDALSRAVRASGTELGRGLATHKLTIDQDYRLITVKQRLKTVKGADLTPEESAKVAELVKKVEEAEAKVKELQAKLPPDAPFPPPPMLKLLGAADRAKYNVRDYIRSKRKADPIGIVADVLGVAKTAKTVWDVSAPGRQGFWLGAAHPIESLSSFKDQMKSLGSQQAFDTVMASIKHDHDYAFSQLCKLEITDAGGVSKDMLNREETQQSRLGERIIPGAAASNRAYAAYLNKLRFQVFKQMIGKLSKDGLPTLKEGKAIANYINIATGRGHLYGDFASAANLLNTMFFSPRYLASRVELLVAQPLWHGTWRTRRMIAGEYVKSVSGMGIVLGLGTLFGATVEMDPRSSDFLKWKIGDTRIDILTGFGPMFTAGSKLATGREKSPATGKLSYPGDIKPLTTIGKFTRSKLAPVTGGFYDYLNKDEAGISRDVQGRSIFNRKEGTFGLPPAVENLLAPMSPTDIVQAVKANGVPESVVPAILSMIGFSVQTHTPKTEQQIDKMEYARARRHLDSLIMAAKKTPDLKPLDRYRWVLDRINKDMAGDPNRALMIKEADKKKLSIIRP